MPETKNPFTSKTLWVNILAIVALFAQNKFGFVLSPEIQVTILALINMGLRLITKTEITWDSGSGSSGGFSSPRLLGGMAMLAIVLLVALVACAGFQAKSKSAQATQALLSAKTAMVGIAESADQMCSQGALSQPQCDTVAKLYKDAKVNYDLAANLLNVAVAVDTPAAWQGYTTGNDKFLAIYMNLTAAAVQFGLVPLTDQGGAK